MPLSRRFLGLSFYHMLIARNIVPSPGYRFN